LRALARMSPRAGALAACVLVCCPALAALARPPRRLPNADGLHPPQIQTKVAADVMPSDAGADTSRCDLRRVAERNALQKMRERDAWVARAVNHTKVDTMMAGALLAPYYPCPWTLEKTASVKDLFDGGKWVCGLAELAAARASACVAYSLGVNFEISFEERILRDTGGECVIHGYDPTMSPPEKVQSWVSGLPRNYHFHDQGIVGGETSQPNASAFGSKSTTLREALRQNGHAGGVDILKFDIEGYEYELLEEMDWASLRIGLILFEVHAGIIEGRLGRPYDAGAFHRHLQRLESAGYRLYSVEPVCLACPGQLELALIHRDWTPQAGFVAPLCPNVTGLPVPPTSGEA